MRRRQRGPIPILAILLWCGAILANGFSQSLPEWLTSNGPPKPTAMGVRDVNGFFSRDSGARKRISAQLLQLETAHDFRIYLMVEPVLIATTAPELAAQLQQIWLPQGNGLVVVYEADSRRIGYGRDVAGLPGPQVPASRIPTHEMAALLDRATAATDQQLAPEAYIEALMANLAREIGGYFERRKAPPPADRSLRLTLLALGGLTLLALGAVLVAALGRLPGAAGSRKFRFPPVAATERLGAPGGGGKVITRRFRSGSRHPGH
jgi:hypothetical protein